ncbi:MAG: DNA-binding protein [bacterium]
MKKVVLSLGALLLVWAAVAFAQPPAMPPMGGMGWGMGSSYNRMYDTSTVETLKGEVISVEPFSLMGAKMEPRPMPMHRGHQGIHLMLKTDKESISVHLGPSWFIENQDMQIMPKDTIEVKGSRITFSEKPAIIAAEVVKGESVLTLRSESGVPVWVGWRKR